MGCNQSSKVVPGINESVYIQVPLITREANEIELIFSQYDINKVDISLIDQITNVTVRKIIPQLISMASAVPIVGSLADVTLQFYNHCLDVFDNIEDFKNFKNKFQNLVTILSDRKDVIQTCIQNDDNKKSNFEHYIKEVVYSLHESKQVIMSYSTKEKLTKIEKMIAVGKMFALSEEFKSKMANASQHMLESRFNLMEYIIFYNVLPYSVSRGSSNGLLKVSTDESLSLLRTVLLNPNTFFDSDIIIHKNHLLPNSRDWLHVKLREWFETVGGTKIFWLKAEAGMGKSAFIAAASTYYKETLGVPTCVFFCKYGDAKRSNGQYIVLSIAYQLACFIPLFKAELLNQDYAKIIVSEFKDSWDDLFNELVLVPLNKCQSTTAASKPIMIIMDALDEIAIQGDPKRKKLLTFLAKNIAKLPNNVRVILTSRPDKDIVDTFKMFNPEEIKTDDPNHVLDLREYVTAELTKKLSNPKEDINEAVNIFMSKSEGKFIYAAMVIDNIFKTSNKKWILDELRQQLPDGLDEKYFTEFQRIKDKSPGMFTDIIQLVMLLVTMKRPLTVKEVSILLDWSIDNVLVKALKIESMFPLRGEKGNDQYFSVFHKSVIDWITDEERSGGDLSEAEDNRVSFYIDVKVANLYFSDRLKLQYNINNNDIIWYHPNEKDSYLVYHLLDHLVGAGLMNESKQLLMTLPWMIKVLEVRGMNALISEFKCRCFDIKTDSSSMSSKSESESVTAAVKLVMDALLLSHNFLTKDGEVFPKRLPLQLYGRLNQIEINNEPLQTLWNACKQWCSHHLTYQPVRLYLEAPGGSLENKFQFKDCLSAVVPLPAAGSDARLAVAEGSVIHIFNRHTAEVEMTLTGHTKIVRSVAVLGDSRLVSGGGDKSIRVWDLTTGQCERVLTGHTDWIHCVAVLSGSRVVSGSDDKTVRVWNIMTGQCELVLDGHSDMVRCLSVLTDGRVVSGSVDNTLRIWNIINGKCEQVLFGHTSTVRCVSTFGHSTIVSGSSDRTLRVWSTVTGECERVLEGHTSDISCIHSLNEQQLNKQTVISGSKDGFMRLWNLTTGECERVIEGHAWLISCLTVLSDGRIVSGSGDNIMRVWNLLIEENSRVLNAHTEWVRCVSMLSDGRVVSGSDDRTLRVWSTVTGECERVLTGHLEGVRNIKVLSDEFITSEDYGKVQLVWEINTGRCMSLQEYAAEGSNTTAISETSTSTADAYNNDGIVSNNDEIELKSYGLDNTACCHCSSKDVIVYGYEDGNVIILKKEIRILID